MKIQSINPVYKTKEPVKSQKTFDRHSFNQDLPVVIPYFIPLFTGRETFLKAFDNLERTLLTQNPKTSALAQIIPEFQAVYDARMSSDHEFSVGKHICEVVKHVLQDEEFKKLPDPEKKILLVATFFHDIGKTEHVITRKDMQRVDFNDLIASKIEKLKIYSTPEIYIPRIKKHLETHEDFVLHNPIHAEISEKIAQKAMQRLNISFDLSKRICHLVGNHSLMSSQIHKAKYRNAISEEEFLTSPQKVSQIITNPKDLKLLKIFDIADEKGSNSKEKLPEKYPQYLSWLYDETLKIITNK